MAPYRASRSFYELDKELAKRFLTEDINVIDVSKIEDFRLREQYQTEANALCNEA